LKRTEKCRAAELYQATGTRSASALPLLAGLLEDRLNRRSFFSRTSFRRFRRTKKKSADESGNLGAVGEIASIQKTTQLVESTMNSPTTSSPRRRKAIRRRRRRKADNVCRLQRVPHDTGWNSNRSVTTTSSKHVYEIRPRKDRRGFELIGDLLPLGLLWFEGPDALVDAVRYAKFYSSSHPAIIRVFDESSTVVAIHESACDFGEPRVPARFSQPFLHPR
jgi:hypothetical protein